jgi:hypothetical protein
MLMLVVFIFICGCSASHEEVTENFSLPPELKDYKIVRLASDTGNHLYVLVKKDGEDRPVIGTTQSGKSPVHVIVIDGEEYVKKAE